MAFPLNGTLLLAPSIEALWSGNSRHYCRVELQHARFLNFLLMYQNLLAFFSEPWESQESYEKKVAGHLYATAIESLRPFTQYKARIKATNDLGTGPPSTVIAVRIKNIVFNREQRKTGTVLGEEFLFFHP